MPKPRKIIFVFIFSLILVFISASNRILFSIGDYLVVQDKLEPADVIHVIAGHDQRTDYAINLLKKGYAKLIFFTGGWCDYYNEYHGQRGKKKSLTQGVPIGVIAIDDSYVKSTYSEAVRLKEYLENANNPINAVIVVSDPYHMRRVRWTYQKVLGPRIKLEMAPVPFELSQYKQKWWSDSISRKMVIDEYLKILYYFARYQFSFGPFKDWLAALDKD